ncbi:MAG: hypothetical protein ACK2UB_14470 [Anaerolineales bacterium]
MIGRRNATGRVLVLLAASIIGGACIASTPMASASSPQVVVITATRDGGGGEAAPTPTFTLEWTATIEAPPTMTAGQELSCVKGPHWALYEWVAKIAEGETVILLARAPEEWADYYYVRKADGTECWAFGGSSVIDGSTAGLPEREAPPLPEITYVIENRTLLNVSGILIRGQDETAWGANRLSADLHPGESFSLPLTAGFYDVQVTDYMGGVLYEEHDIPIGSDPGSRTTLVQPMIRFYFENTHPNAICELKTGPMGGTLSEVTIPDDGVIDPGEQIGLELLAGKYQFSFQGCGGAFFGAYGNVYVGPAMEGVP